MLTLGFVCRVSSPTNRRLVRLAGAAGHRVRIVGDPEQSLAVGRLGEAPDVLFGRVSAGDGNAEFQLTCQRALETAGVPVVNRAESVAAALRKSSQALLFAGARIPHPVTMVITPYADPDELVDRLGLPVVLKPDTGRGGNGIFCPGTRDELRQDLRDVGMAGAQVLIAQRHVPEAVRNLRVVVIDGEAVVGMERAAPVGGWLSNMSQGASGHPAPLSREERELAVRATTGIGLDIAGVDLVRTPDGPIVLEVNSAPGLLKTQSVTGVDLCSRVLSALVARAHPDPGVPASVPTISA